MKKLQVLSTTSNTNNQLSVLDTNKMKLQCQKFNDRFIELGYDISDVNGAIDFLEKNPKIHYKTINCYRYINKKTENVISLGISKNENDKSEYRKHKEKFFIGMCSDNYPTLSQLSFLDKQERQSIAKLFLLELKGLIEWYNCSNQVSNSQLSEIVMEIKEEYKTLSVEDVIHCISLAKKGKIQCLKNVYNNFSAPLLLQMFQEYDIEVSKVREQSYLKKRNKEVCSKFSVGVAMLGERILNSNNESDTKIKEKLQKSIEQGEKPKTMRELLKDKKYLEFKRKMNEKNQLNKIKNGKES